MARRLERAAYRAADRIVVLSRSFTENLVAKGVPLDKIELIYDPATRIPTGVAASRRGSGLRLLSMGNIGHTQGLTPLVRAFEAHPALTGEARLVITGTGVAAEEARCELVSNRVQMLGMVEDERLERELRTADVALVTQRYDGTEFNLPSKLMNFMSYGLPILAAVNPDGEVARLVKEARAGWIVDSGDPDAFPREVARIASAATEVSECAANAQRYAERHFTQTEFAARFEATLRSVQLPER
jgi:colanic acid biosynthesis glycosyl transferase WcaI